ncbi:hypothetical protein C8R44DRAFT_726894 [Mycena epipterygia]|nr:hypothetical protein C8R44DRAFT_726894 [Mycena epipterygia]
MSTAPWSPFPRRRCCCPARRRRRILATAALLSRPRPRSRPPLVVPPFAPRAPPCSHHARATPSAPAPAFAPPTRRPGHGWIRLRQTGEGRRYEKLEKGAGGIACDKLVKGAGGFACDKLEKGAGGIACDKLVKGAGTRNWRRAQVDLTARIRAGGIACDKLVKGAGGIACDKLVKGADGFACDKLEKGAGGFECANSCRCNCLRQTGDAPRVKIAGGIACDQLEKGAGQYSWVRLGAGGIACDKHQSVAVKFSRLRGRRNGDAFEDLRSTDCGAVQDCVVGFVFLSSCGGRRLTVILKDGPISWCMSCSRESSSAYIIT